MDKTTSKLFEDCLQAILDLREEINRLKKNVAVLDKQVQQLKKEVTDDGR